MAKGKVDRADGLIEFIHREARARRAKRPTLNPVQVEALGVLAWQVWQAIGADCLREVPGGVMTRANVIEVVLDCERLEEEIKRAAGTQYRFGLAINQETKEALLRFIKEADMPTIERTLRARFEAPSYA